MEEIKNKILDDFIDIMKSREINSKFDIVFSYDDIYKIISYRIQK